MISNLFSKKGNICLLRYPDPKHRILNRVISDISVLLRETTHLISDSIDTVSTVESEIVRVVSLGTTEITEITRFNTNLQGPDTLKAMGEFPTTTQQQKQRH